MERGLERQRQRHRVGVARRCGRRSGTWRCRREARGSRTAPPGPGLPRASSSARLAPSRSTPEAAPVTLASVPTPVAAIDHYSGAEPIAAPKEPRQRRPRHQRTGHQQRRLSLPVAVSRRDRDRHEAEGGEIVGKPRARQCGPISAGDDRAEEESGGLEPGAEHVGRVETAAAARRAFPLLALGYLRGPRRPGCSPAAGRGRARDRPGRADPESGTR